MIVLIAAGQQPNSGVDPDAAVRDDRRFHRRHRQGRHPDRQHRVQDDLRRRDDPVPADPGHQHDRDPLRAQVPAGLRMSRPARDRSRAPRDAAVLTDLARPGAARADASRTGSSRSRMLACLGGRADRPRSPCSSRTSVKGIGSLNLDFFTDYASSFPENAGIRPALLGHDLADGRSARCSSSPSGSPAPSTWRSTRIATAGTTASSRSTSRTSPRFPRSSTASSASPSWSAARSSLGRSVLAGGLTLALLVLPVVIIAAREAIRAVPPSIREGSMALGATKWQTIWKQVLPAAIPGIATGVILAALAGDRRDRAADPGRRRRLHRPSTPAAWTRHFTVLPLQIFNWISQPQDGVQGPGRGGDPRPAGRAAGDERGGDLASQQVRAEMVIGSVRTCGRND